MKIVIIVIVIAILGIGAYLVLGGQAPEPALAPANETGSAALTPEQPSVPAVGATTDVIYTAQGFSPSIVTIRVGDSVRFVNQSTLDMWVGSDEHPTHTEYDGTKKDDHCPNPTNTVFDQCSSGDSYTFTFTKAGTWGYHNHKVKEDTGTVVVTN